MLHRGVRSQHESSSHFGQIVHNIMPVQFTFIDVDAAIYRERIGLLRIIEHKSPGQHQHERQRQLLEHLALVIEDARPHFDMHADSGVFLVEGDPHQGNQMGPATVTDYLTGQRTQYDSEEDLLCWVALLDEKPERCYDRNVRKIFPSGREFVHSRLERRRASPPGAA